MSDKIKELKDLAGLLEKGLLSREEFEQEKKRILASSDVPVKGPQPPVSGRTLLEEPPDAPPVEPAPARPSIESTSSGSPESGQESTSKSKPSAPLPKSTDPLVSAGPDPESSSGSSRAVFVGILAVVGLAAVATGGWFVWTEVVAAVDDGESKKKKKKDEDDRDEDDRDEDDRDEDDRDEDDRDEDDRDEDDRDEDDRDEDDTEMEVAPVAMGFHPLDHGCYPRDSGESYVFITGFDVDREMTIIHMSATNVGDYPTRFFADDSPGQGFHLVGDGGYPELYQDMVIGLTSLEYAEQVMPGDTIEFYLYFPRLDRTVRTYDLYESDAYQSRGFDRQATTVWTCLGITLPVDR